jgi:hypothetical protein
MRCREMPTRIPFGRPERHNSRSRGIHPSAGSGARRSGGSGRLEPHAASDRIRSVADRWLRDSNQLIVKFPYTLRY